MGNNKLLDAAIYAGSRAPHSNNALLAAAEKDSEAYGNLVNALSGRSGYDNAYWDYEESPSRRNVIDEIERRKAVEGVLPSLASAARDVAWQLPQGFNEGLDNTLNLPYNLIRGGVSLAGEELPPAEPMFARLNSGVKPEGKVGEYARTVGEMTPNVVIPTGGLASTLAKNAVLPGVLSEYLGQETKGTSAEPYARAVGALAGPFAPGAWRRAMDSVAPSAEEAGRTLNTFAGAGAKTADKSSLPMDEASRMERSRQLGYSDEPFYRGEATGQLPDAYSEAFFSRNASTAGGFANRGGQSEPREFRLNLQNAFGGSRPLTAKQFGSILDAAEKHDPQLAGNLLSLIELPQGKDVGWLRGYVKARPDDVLMRHGDIRALIMRSAAPETILTEAGYDALLNGEDVRKLTGSGIRLRNARFNPDEANSRNILAGTVPFALGIPAYGVATSRQD